MTICYMSQKGLGQAWDKLGQTNWPISTKPQCFQQVRLFSESCPARGSPGTEVQSASFSLLSRTHPLTQVVLTETTEACTLNGILHFDQELVKKMFNFRTLVCNDAIQKAAFSYRKQRLERIFLDGTVVAMI